jgi:hypothetical protein
MRTLLLALYLVCSFAAADSLDAVKGAGGWPVVERTVPVTAKTVKIAVIDTGAQVTHLGIKEHLCVNEGETGKDARGRDKSNNGIDDDGNGFIDDVYGWNFVDNNNDLTDHHGHGTHIAGLVALEAGSADYCLIILRYYDPKSNESNNLINTVKSIMYANKMGASVINYSGGGLAPSEEERAAVTEFLDRGGLFVAAAGNERSDINIHKYYPAAYDPRIVMVSAHDRGNAVLPTSNYSGTLSQDRKVDSIKPGEMKVEYELGNNVYSTLPGDQYGYMTGTSQATAIMTGTLVNRMSMLRGDKYLGLLYERKPPMTHHRRPASRLRMRRAVRRAPAGIAGIPMNDAESHALDAAYMQSGLKGEVDEMTKMLEKRYITNDMKEIAKYGGVPYFILKAVIDKQLAFKFTW